MIIEHVNKTKYKKLEIQSKSEVKCGYKATTVMHLNVVNCIWTFCLNLWQGNRQAPQRLQEAPYLSVVLLGWHYYDPQCHNLSRPQSIYQTQHINNKLENGNCEKRRKCNCEKRRK
jgi:hypothetical protein